LILVYFSYYAIPAKSNKVTLYDSNSLATEFNDYSYHVKSITVNPQRTISVWQ